MKFPQNKTHKLLIIVGIILLGLFVWPIVLGVVVGYFAYTKISNPILRYSTLAVVFVISFSLTVSWLTGTFESPTANQTQVESEANQSLADENKDEAEEKVAEKDTIHKVTRVIDGDTIDVEIDGNTERVRLLGIDTPETVDPRKPVECFGKEASDMATNLLEGKSVRLEADESQDNRDKYDRLLRYVFLEDGTNINKLMVAEGFAHEYTYDSEYKYQSEFKTAEDEAMESKKGLWADNTCIEVTSTKDTNTQKEKEEAQIKTNPPVDNLSCECGANIYNCSDFSSHASAQSTYNCCIQKVGYDVHDLDRDNDGQACESLP